MRPSAGAVSCGLSVGACMTSAGWTWTTKGSQHKLEAERTQLCQVGFARWGVRCSPSTWERVFHLKSSGRILCVKEASKQLKFLSTFHRITIKLEFMKVQPIQQWKGTSLCFPFGFYGVWSCCIYIAVRCLRGVCFTTMILPKLDFCGCLPTWSADFLGDWCSALRVKTCAGVRSKQCPQ